MKGRSKTLITILVAGFVLGGCGQKKQSAIWSPHKSPVADQLKQFVIEKKAQAIADAALKHNELQPDVKRLFAAAEKGDALEVSNIYEDLKRIAPRYGSDADKDKRLSGVQWQVAKEVGGAFDCFASADDDYQYSAIGHGIIESIPPGSIYLGGTDSGRWVITTLQKSHMKGEPFFTLTQNALVDPTYLDYLRGMYGDKIYIPTPDDSQKCFQDYVSDVGRRIQHDRTFPGESKQLKPGENVNTDASGHVQISGQVTVMAINAEMVRMVFDHETNREFYVEESFPLDWMYPHLEPHGLIMKINREPLAELPEDVIQKDHEFWKAQIAPVIGDWLKEDTTVQEICAFEEKVYFRHDFNGFKGDPRFVSDDWPHWMSKLRSSIGGIYLWRIGRNPSGAAVPAEAIAKGETRDRIAKEADFAFRQAFAICPDSPEVVFRYGQFLVDEKRTADALAVAEVAMNAAKGKPGEKPFQYLIDNIKTIRNQESKSPPTAGFNR